MESRIARALNLEYQPVAILWTDEKPADAHQFAVGRWGCVMAAFAATAEKGRIAAFDRETYGCVGGGVGLGFGNQYVKFPGGLECFYRFLSDGNERSEEGRAVGERIAAFIRGEMGDHFLHGEGYRKTPELAKGFVQNVPLMDIPGKYVVFKPLSRVADNEQPVVVVFLANPDQLSALVVLANYGRPDNENVIIPYAAGCQTIGIYPYREAQKEQPRAVVGLSDISARKCVRRLGKDIMSFAVPHRLFLEMEGNVAGSFLEKDCWKSLQER